MPFCDYREKKGSYCSEVVISLQRIEETEGIFLYGWKAKMMSIRYEGRGGVSRKLSFKKITPQNQGVIILGVKLYCNISYALKNKNAKIVEILAAHCSNGKALLQ